ncbi:MAG: rhomboid family intramembrane serine protease [Gemmatimonadaceae bacterium]|nr:rhomboid family intramembrane serine protease [Gemmatimonadaceae bacterium]
MFPIGDDNPTLRTPLMTYFLLATTFAAWVFIQGAGFDPRLLAASVCNLGLVPGELSGMAPLGTGVPIGAGLACVIDHDPINLATPVLSMFLHGSWGHILGNALFFWVFGNNVEDVMGRFRFLAFYLLCGIAAGLAHVLVDPASPVPTVGASGAISGVMGAYLLLFPAVRVRMLFIFVIFWKTFRVAAWLVLLWWFALQVWSGLPQLISPNPEIAGGVAVWAHAGGFVAGALLIRFFADPRLVARHRAVLAAARVRSD